MIEKEVIEFSIIARSSPLESMNLLVQKIILLIFLVQENSLFFLLT